LPLIFVHGKRSEVCEVVVQYGNEFRRLPQKGYLMKLILKVDERLVDLIIEFHASKHCTDNERADLLRAGLDMHLKALSRLSESVSWGNLKGKQFMKEYRSA